jgi:hypothetical protein
VPAPGVPDVVEVPDRRVDRQTPGDPVDEVVDPPGLVVVGTARLDHPQDGERGGIPLRVVGHRHRGIGEVDVDAAQPVGVGDPQEDDDDVVGRHAGVEEQIGHLEADEQDLTCGRGIGHPGVRRDGLAHRHRRDLR